MHKLGLGCSQPLRGWPRCMATANLPRSVLPTQAGPVIDAGGIFEFARSTGMIKAKASA